MSKIETPEYVVLWIEDQLGEVEWGVNEFERLLGEGLGCQIRRLAALTVAEAEAKLAGLADDPPGLIVLDLMLPRTNRALNAKPSRVDMNAGFLLWYRLRMVKAWGSRIASVPIIVITARGNPEYRAMMEQDDGLVWLSKPIGPSEVVKKAMALVKGLAATQEHGGTPKRREGP